MVEHGHQQAVKVGFYQVSNPHLILVTLTQSSPHPHLNLTQTSP